MKEGFIYVGNLLLNLAKSDPNKCIEVILDLSEGKTEDATKMRIDLIDGALKQFK